MAADEARFLERYRQALQDTAGRPVELDEGEVEAVLDLARDVAHGSERRHAPLATFLAGQFVVARAADGTPVAAALEEARALAGELLGDAEP
ncbi:MAG TPA: DUF6457 domain-containing protein [Acidimicrobiales bacterium]|nr:DUF6457 domain-containing protein [Acidimicrobiales bacterium]